MKNLEHGPASSSSPSPAPRQGQRRPPPPLGITSVDAATQQSQILRLPAAGSAASTAAVVQRAAEGAGPSPAHIHAAARAGIRSPSSRLPFQAELQAHFAPHDLSSIQAHIGPEASRAARSMKATAFTTGEHIVFAGPPRRETVLHETTHVLQQRQGLHLPEGVGQAGDRWEQQAEGVARGGRSPDLAGPTLNTAAPTQQVQLEREAEFKQDPEAFLRANLLSLTMGDGVLVRAPGAATPVKEGLQAFVKKLRAYQKHWFTLVPDQARTKKDRPAYILTPAVERYIEAYPADALLSSLAGKAGIPAKGAEESYLLSGYVEYKNIGVADVPSTIGHSKITADADAEEVFKPDLVFTAAMNGCAFAITPAEEGTFTAWHFQSPGANHAQAAAFRRDQGVLDWYGTEEYERDTQHAGLFEVTNFLHRKNNQWSVLSQQNETGKVNLNDVSTKAVESRPINLAPTNRFALTHRIYSALARDRNAVLLRALSNTLDQAHYLDAKCQLSLRMLGESLRYLMNSEQQSIQGATTMAELRTVDAEIVRVRRLNLPRITTACDAIQVHIQARYEAENGKWFGRGETAAKQLNLCRTNLIRVVEKLGEYEWASELVVETTAP